MREMSLNSTYTSVRKMIESYKNECAVLNNDIDLNPILDKAIKDTNENTSSSTNNLELQNKSLCIFSLVSFTLNVFLYTLYRKRITK